jgi:hypothetical protein
MASDRTARILEGLRRLLQLDRAAHELPADSAEALIVQRRLDEQRKLVRRLATDDEEDEATG